MLKDKTSAYSIWCSLMRQGILVSAVCKLGCVQSVRIAAFAHMIGWMAGAIGAIFLQAAPAFL